MVDTSFSIPSPYILGMSSEAGHAEKLNAEVPAHSKKKPTAKTKRYMIAFLFRITKDHSSRPSE